MSRDWLLYLDDIIEAAEKIHRFVGGRTIEEFTSSEAEFDAVLFNLQVIGEAVKNLPEAARNAMPEVDWSGPARLRDLIAHRYFSLDDRIVWDVAVHRIPEVLAAARRLAEQQNREPQEQ